MLDELLEELPLIWGAEDPEETDEETEEETEETAEEEEEEEDDEPDDKRKHPKSAKAAQPAKKATPGEKKYTPPSQREWEKTRAALRKANQEQQANRQAALEKARKQGMDEAAVKAREEALAEANKEYLPKLVRAEARAELLHMGCKNPSRLLKLVEADKVTIQGDDFLGLEEQLNELKDEWPELFKGDEQEDPAKAKKKVAGTKKVGAAAGNKKDDADRKSKSSTDVIANRLLGVGHADN